MVIWRYLILLLTFILSAQVFAVEQTRSSNDGRVRVVLELPETDLLTRQFRLLQYRVYTNDAFITLDVDVNKYPQSHLQMLPVKKQASTIKKWKYQYQFNVLSYFSVAGKKQYETPALRYSEGGRVHYLFEFHPMVINVKALPPYLPPYIPMGQLKLDSRFPEIFDQLRPAKTDSVYYWDIYIRGKNISKDALPELLQQIRSNRQIKFLPAKITSGISKQHESVTQTLHYSIPFMIKQSGLARFPDLRLQYFDPASGRMHVSQYQINNKLALNLPLQWLLVLLLLALLIWVLVIIKPVIYRIALGLIQLKKGRQQLKQAQTPVEVRQSMRQLGQAFGWPVNATLNSWQANWQENIADSESVNASLSKLSLALYSPVADLSLNTVKKTLLCHGFLQVYVCLRHALQAQMEPSLK